MRYLHTPFTVHVRAGLIGSAAGLLVLGTTLSGTALAADQRASTDTTAAATPTSLQTTGATQTPEALGPHTHQLHGVVKSTPASGATTFTLTTEGFGDVTVWSSAATQKARGHGHGAARSHELVNVAELQAGERVVVQGQMSADGKSYIARRVHVLPVKGAKTTHIVGTVSAVASAAAGTTLTVKLADGTTQSITVGAESKIRPDGKTLSDLTVGTKVTVVSKDGVATGVAVLPA